MRLPRADRVPRILVTTVATLVTVALLGASGPDDVLREAEAVVAQAVPGDPLEVVTTTLSAAGRPLITTQRAASRQSARSLVVAALRDSGVHAVSMARPVRIAASNDSLRPRQWALSRLRAETVWRTTKGQATRSTRRAVVAVVDTGVDAAHPDLKGNVLAGRDEVAPGTSAADEHGHGTHVAGTIVAVADNRRGVAGLAPRAAVLPVRVLDATGGGRSDALARGIVWAADRKPHVINLSLSYTGRDRAVESAVAYARSKGVLVVAAAGNSGCGLLLRPTQQPAAQTGVVGVGSIDSSARVSSFSSCGSWVDLLAPGGAIISTVPRANRAGCGTTSYCTLSGTSMAAPHVSAAAAMAMARRKWTATTVASRLERTAQDLGPAGKDSRHGAGLLDVRRLLG